MDILLTSATRAEIAPLTELMHRDWKQENEHTFSNSRYNITILTTGVGMVATTYALTRSFAQKRFDLAIQAGIGGSFNRSIPLGSVLLVTSEIFADIGAEDHYNFLDVFELGLEDRQRFPYQDGKLLMPRTILHDNIKLPEASGLTINMISGSSFTALSRYQQYGCTVESMEGAAFHYVCLQEKIPFAQIRSISNYVEARNRSSWKIKEAVVDLNAFLIRYFTAL